LLWKVARHGRFLLAAAVVRLLLEGGAGGLDACLRRGQRLPAAADGGAKVRRVGPGLLVGLLGRAGHLVRDPGAARAKGGELLLQLAVLLGQLPQAFPEGALVEVLPVVPVGGVAFLTGTRQRFFLQAAEAALERAGAGGSRNQLGVVALVTLQAPERADGLAPRQRCEDDVEGGGVGGEEEHPFAPGRGLGDDLGHDPRLAGARRSLDQAEVGALHGAGDGFTLGGVQAGVVDRERQRPDRLEVPGLSGEQPAQERTARGGAGAGAVAGGRRQLVLVEHSLPTGQGEQFFLLLRRGVLVQILPGGGGVGSLWSRSGVQRRRGDSRRPRRRFRHHGRSRLLPPSRGLPFPLSHPQSSVDSILVDWMRRHPQPRRGRRTRGPCPGRTACSLTPAAPCPIPEVAP
jgi:hypothetical protein